MSAASRAMGRCLELVLPDLCWLLDTTAIRIRVDDEAAFGIEVDGELRFRVLTSRHSLWYRFYLVDQTPGAVQAQELAGEFPALKTVNEGEQYRLAVDVLPRYRLMPDEVLFTLDLLSVARKMLAGGPVAGGDRPSRPMVGTAGRVCEPVPAPEANETRAFCDRMDQLFFGAGLYGNTESD